MMKRILLISLLVLPVSVWADGIVIPEPWVDLAIVRHIVNVSVQDQAVVTEIDQSFLNLAPFGEVEGIYMFPVPEEAAISAFSMFVDGEQLIAELLLSDEARRIYTEIVQQRIDPALLEYAGRGAYRARIFPIVAGVEKRVQLTYTEVIPERNEVRKYVYPLNTEKFSARPLDLVMVRVEIEASDPIKSVYSPSHKIEIQRTDDHHVTVVYADEEMTPKTDFILYYSVSRGEVGINLLTYREPGQEGFYMVLAAPKVETVESEAARKRVALVLDRSGSMSGEKIVQARDALKFVLRNLNPQDEFNIFDYSTLVSSFTSEMLPVSPGNISEASDYIDKLEATGGTNIHGSLLAALGQLRKDDYVNMIIFMTDGLATVGTTVNDEILADIKERNDQNARIFAFGVGYDVNTHLLDRLGTENHGTSTYVKPGEDIETEVSAFYAQVSHPVLSDIGLDFGTVEVLDLYPSGLPDIFKGSQIVQIGRYMGEGETTLTLSGTADGEPLSYSRQASFPLEDKEHEFLPRLWATRKIGFLLDQIRLNGEDQELVDEIISLSRTYGIITPYTSFLIVEDEPPTPILFGDEFLRDSGADAVAASESTRSLAGATAAPQDPVASGKGGVQVVGTKTFYLRDDVWVDAEYTKSDPLVAYQFGSEGYFELVSRNLDLAPYLALGTELIVRYEDITYRIGVGERELGWEESDFNGDGWVNFADFLRLARHFGRNAGQPGFDETFDLDEDGTVGFLDFLVFVASFGAH